jgi:hypothetical protein
MKISGYITIRNAEQMNYPYKEAIRSLYEFCDEITVCDTSDNTDDTTKQLIQLSSEFKKEFQIIRPKKDEVDWNAPNSGIYDGYTKALARNACTGDYCFQIDADEIVSTTREQVERMIEASGMNEENPLIALPVVEYWGSKGKVRIDVNPWKWRLSLNLSYITHGIPLHMRKKEDGLIYAKHGSDGCDYIHKYDGHIIPCINFVKPKVEKVRRLAVHDMDAAKSYENWFNNIADKMPTVYHFSWWSVYQKMLKYKHFWNDSWIRLYNEQRPLGYNPFFNKSFNEITEEEMLSEARKLETETGGHIFHQPWNGQKTNSIIINHPFPDLVKNWCEKNKTPE